MRPCPSCGQSVASDTDRFCPNCGAQLPAAAPANAGPAPAHSASTTTTTQTAPTYTTPAYLSGSVGAGDVPTLYQGQARGRASGKSPGIFSTVMAMDARNLLIMAAVIVVAIIALVLIFKIVSWFLSLWWLWLIIIAAAAYAGRRRRRRFWYVKRHPIASRPSPVAGRGSSGRREPPRAGPLGASLYPVLPAAGTGRPLRTPATDRRVADARP